MDGIISIYKTKGMTSHGVVSRLRRILNMKKIGHTGTLDPDVTGVIPICVGKATRVSEYILEGDKEYIGELTLGMKTDSQDYSGKVLASSNLRASEEDIFRAFNSYIGEIKQLPPMYSAVRHKGKKLYELAREGITVERKPRQAFIYDLKIMRIDSGKILFYVHCSKGTYIRTLCNDIGDDLGTYGYMSFLTRIAVEDFKSEDSYSLDVIESMVDQGDYSFLQPIDRGVRKLDSLEVDGKLYSQVINGMKIPVNLPESKSVLRIYCKGDFLGLGRILSSESGNFLKMDKVLI